MYVSLCAVLSLWFWCVRAVYPACRHLTFNHRDLWTVKHFAVICRQITLSRWVNARPSGTCSKAWQTALHLPIQDQCEIYCLQLHPSRNPWRGLLMTQSIHNLFNNSESFCGHQKTKLINYQQWSQQACESLFVIKNELQLLSLFRYDKVKFYLTFWWIHFFSTSNPYFCLC